MHDAAPHPSPAPARRSTAGRWLAGIAIVLLVVLVAIGGLVAAAWKSERGARLLWDAARSSLGGRLQGELAGGTLSTGLRLRGLRYRDDVRQVDIDRADAAWSWDFTPPRLTVSSLRIGRVDVRTLATPPDEPATMPDAIRLPLAFELRDATIGQLALHDGGDATVIRDIALAASSDRVRHAFALNRADTPAGRARATVTLQGEAPYALTGNADLAGEWEGEAFRLDLALGGSLPAPDLQLRASGDRLQGEARIHASPFEPVPLRSADVRVLHVNPRLFKADAPRADLEIRATLTPVEQRAARPVPPAGGDAKRAPGELGLTGPVTIVNAIPGPIDKGLLPLAGASAELWLSRERQRLPRLELRLAGDGILRGRGEIGADGRGSFVVDASRLDLSALHGSLAPTRLAGPLAVRTAKDAQEITLDWSDDRIAARADARIDERRLTLRSATLAAAGGRLEISGALDRAEANPFSIEGRTVDLDPSAFLAAVQRAQPDKDARRNAGKRGNAAAPAARINAGFGLRGRLAPELSVDARFEIGDSVYAGLPMTGRGRAQLAGQRLADSDVRASIAGNDIRFNGGFGTPSARLVFHVDAPALDRLGFGLAGLLQADGELRGTLDRPAVDATWRAENLALGGYRAARLAGRARTRGIPGRNPEARVELDVDGAGIAAADLRLESLAARVDGTYGRHDIVADARGTLRGQPLDAGLTARGRLQESAAGYGWSGEVARLENRGFPRLAAAAPFGVTAAPGRLGIERLRLTLEKADIDLRSFAYGDGTLRSEGSISALDVGHLLELRRQLTGEPAPVRADLVLDGRWNVSLARSASGFVEIGRRSGDLRIPNGQREIALGLERLQLRADLRGRGMRLDMRTAAARIGTLDSVADIGLLDTDGILMPGPESPLSGRITGGIPRLQSIASLAGPRVALDGRIEAALTVAGTLGAPVLSGDIDGRDLALTVYDQGVRLTDGVARIRIDGNVAEMREVVFRGGDGTLRATGKIPLDQHNPDLTATIVADRLQLLSSPTGQLTVSGRASAANVAQQLEVTGRFRVDRARFALPEKSAPELDGDVVIVRGTQRVAKAQKTEEQLPPGERRAGRFSPRLRIEVELGDDFRFAGSGADLLLTGGVRLESVPGAPPQAFGTVRIVEGVYEAFGAKLAIERGVINLQGSTANPNINILAMRRGTEVSAGVNVTGTVRQPRVRLVSEPDMPDEEKLSWLVFGRGSAGASDAGPGQAQAAAKKAALGLVNKFGAGRVARGLGLDQLAIGSSEYGLGTQQVVTLGKEISDRLSIGYEQSLEGAASVLKLTYELSHHWSVVLRGGTVAGLDLYFSKRFDRPGERAERGEGAP